MAEIRAVTNYKLKTVAGWGRVKHSNLRTQKMFGTVRDSLTWTVTRTPKPTGIAYGSVSEPLNGQC